MSPMERLFVGCARCLCIPYGNIWVYHIGFLYLPIRIVSNLVNLCAGVPRIKDPCANRLNEALSLFYWMVEGRMGALVSF